MIVKPSPVRRRRMGKISRKLKRMHCIWLLSREPSNVSNEWIYLIVRTTPHKLLASNRSCFGESKDYLKFSVGISALFAYCLVRKSNGELRLGF